jgi:hypothetical protein
MSPEISKFEFFPATAVAGTLRGEPIDGKLAIFTDKNDHSYSQNEGGLFLYMKDLNKNFHL